MKPQAKHLDSCIAAREVFVEISSFYNSFATLRSAYSAEVASATKAGILLRSTSE